MAIHETTGNLLDDDAQGLVNTVNCVGVMGKGIALDFKKAYPVMYINYRAYCATGRLKPGEAYTWNIPHTTRWVINLATKSHWNNPSELDWIVSGVETLFACCEQLKLSSIAIPPLGCGNGGLNWAIVKPIIIKGFKGTGVEVHLYNPL